MKSLVTLFFGNPVVLARSKVKDAVEDYARKLSEMQYHQYLHFYHQDAAKNTDHETLWWEFAEHKQKCLNHYHEMEYWDKRAKDANAKLLARMARLSELQKTGHGESQID